MIPKFSSILRGFAGSGPFFGFREAVADSLDLVTERTRAEEGAIGPTNQVAHAVGMGQPKSRGIIGVNSFFAEKRIGTNKPVDTNNPGRSEATRLGHPFITQGAASAEPAGILANGEARQDPCHSRCGFLSRRRSQREVQSLRGAHHRAAVEHAFYSPAACRGFGDVRAME